MKKNTVNYLALMLATAFLASGCNGLKKMAANSDLVQRSITPSPLEMHAGRVPVSITVTFPPKYFDKKAYLVCTPTLKSDNFGGEIKIMVGFAPDGTILGYEILEQQETPGLGTHVVEWFKDASKPGQNILGRKADGQFKVSKEGGSVDAITAATISSKAFLAAVNQAYADFAEQAGLDKPDGVAGASILKKVEEQVTEEESVIEEKEAENE